MGGRMRRAAGLCLVGLAGTLWGGAETERLGFGPFEFANPGREARILVGPDESQAVRAAVAEVVGSIRARTGVTVAYSSYSSPIAGDVFVSTQPWAAKGAWFVRLGDSNIVAVHGSDEEGTLAAVRALHGRIGGSATGPRLRCSRSS